jgi:hypothetical protein
MHMYTDICIYRNVHIYVYVLYNIMHICTYSYTGIARSRQRYVSPEHLRISHIPRIGYVTLFPFLMNIIPAERLGSVLDIIEVSNLWFLFCFVIIYRSFIFIIIGDFV